ncbi:isochorismatase family protein [Lacimicrobium sp. SS2-24]|uniref:isochorismatase family protein n=1 Tax=Lacimicrobium sp. SS2-24 TaxID=2005569 RepID=UPI000B4B43CB|nr:isochorismatase family protein [Lacimicrobium sp. SS2-24]
MILDKAKSLLLLIDMQEKLLPVIDNAEALTRAAEWALQVASEVGVPHLVTEQYPQGIGPTAARLISLVDEQAVIQKLTFSAWQEPAFVKQLSLSQRGQIVVMGTEAHVCVLQTVLDLIAAGYEVYVLSDAVGSRQPQHKDQALIRMQQAGAILINQEMMAFEWLERADTELFRKVHRGWIR